MQGTTTLCLLLFCVGAPLYILEGQNLNTLEKCAVRTPNGVRRDWKYEEMLHNSSFVIITG